MSLMGYKSIFEIEIEGGIIKGKKNAFWKK